MSYHKPNALVSFWNRHTYGSATLDIARTHIFDDAIESAAIESIPTTTEPASEETNPFINSRGPSPPPPPPPPLRDARDGRDVKATRFSSSGVRLKVMRHVALGPEWTQREHGMDVRSPIIDAAAGVSFEFDSASFQPKARVRLLRTVSIGAFPCPHIKVGRRIPIGLTGFSVKVLYVCPLRHLNRAFDAPARLIFSIDDTDHYGVRLVTNGVEVAGNRVVECPFGELKLMGSAVVQLPSRLELGGGQRRLVEDSGNFGDFGDFGVRLGRTALKLKF